MNHLTSEDQAIATRVLLRGNYALIGMTSGDDIDYTQCSVRQMNKVGCANMARVCIEVATYIVPGNDMEVRSVY